VDTLISNALTELRLRALPTPQREPVNLEELLRDLEAEIAIDLETKGMRLHIEVPAGLSLMADRKLLHSALSNLVRNAVEAMEPKGGKLVIRAQRDGTDFVLDVSDTGRGIPNEIRDRLFQSFVTSGKRGGTGLGLAIVKKIVDEHSGSIAVDSSAQGTTFTIRIPQETLPAPSPSPTPGTRIDEATGLPLVHAPGPASAAASASKASGPGEEAPPTRRGRVPATATATAAATAPAGDEASPPTRRGGRPSSPGGHQAGRTG